MRAQSGAIPPILRPPIRDSERCTFGRYLGTPFLSLDFTTTPDAFPGTSKLSVFLTELNADVTALIDPILLPSVVAALDTALDADSNVLLADAPTDSTLVPLPPVRRRRLLEEDMVMHSSTKSDWLTPVRILLLLLPATASGQSAGITGRITDPADHVIRGASIVVSDPATSQQRRAESGEEGYYTVPLMKPGVYEISVAYPGFETALQPRVALSVNEIARLDFTLSLAGVREQITVDAQSPGLDRETSSLGGVVRGPSVLELPLLGRNPYALGLLVPGVRTAVGMNNLVTDVFSTSAVSIDGGRNNMNSFLLEEGGPSLVES